MRANTRSGHDRGYPLVREGTFLRDRRIHSAEVQGDQRHRELAGGVRADPAVAGVSEEIQSDETVLQVQLRGRQVNCDRDAKPFLHDGSLPVSLSSQGGAQETISAATDGAGGVQRRR